MFDLHHPLFLALWRRILVVAVTLGWTGVEISAGETAWALVFGAAALWCAYQFFVIWDPERAAKGGKSR